MRLLAVSRDAAVLCLLHAFEAERGWRVETVASSWDAMEAVQSGEAPGTLLLDIARGDGDSLHFLRWLQRMRNELPVVLACYPEEAIAGKEALRAGVGEMLVRPFESKQLEHAIQRQLSAAKMTEPETVREDDEALGRETFFISSSLITEKLRAQAALMAKTDVPVLIVGERGSGKYALARLIHSLSVRSGFKLRKLNCAEMPASLLEAELFDAEVREEEAFARDACTELGRFVAGEKDTIFLDEITALPDALQSRLLELLEAADSRDACAAISPNVRILAGSSANLDRALAEKRLQEDLYYRLSAFTVNVPPVRQRKDEIPTLLCYFMHKLAKYYSLPPREFSASVVEACQQYPWPENLNEMETFVKRYLVAGDVELLTPDSNRIGQALERATSPIRPTTTSVPTSELARDPQPESLRSLIQSVKSEAEQNAIAAALRRTGWNRKAAARLLRVSYRTLLYKIEQYHMRAPAPYFSALTLAKFSEFEEAKGNGKAS